MEGNQDDRSIEALIQRGIEGIKTGVYISIRNAAKSLGIKRSTLVYCYQGRQLHLTAH